MAMGVPPADLSDEDLRRELTHLREKADKILGGGTDEQKENHRRRTAELEAEAQQRWPRDS